MPSVVLPSAVVGCVTVLQQTPLAVIAALPVLVMVPPLVAVVAAIADMAAVVVMGNPASVVKLTWSP